MNVEQARTIARGIADIFSAQVSTPVILDRIFSPDLLSSSLSKPHPGNVLYVMKNAYEEIFINSFVSRHRHYLIGENAHLLIIDFTEPLGENQTIEDYVQHNFYVAPLDLI